MWLRMRVALAFLTVLPVRLPEKLAEEDLTGSASFFPFAGWVTGALLAGVAGLAAWLSLPPLPAAVLLVSLEAWFTRALHLDGLADLLDALGGGNTPERRLAIMKDSAIGAFGVVGLVCLLLLKVSVLSALLGRPGLEKYLILAAIPALSRWAMTVLASRARYPRATGTGHSFVGKISPAALAVGFLFCLPVLALGPAAGALLFPVCLLPVLWLRLRAGKALGGITGDVLGAGCELGEAAGWLAALLLL